MNTILNTIWYGKHPLRWLLWPIALMYQWVAWIRRRYLESVVQHTFDVPIIVVGNLTVGGVGKTPLVIALTQALQARGLRVGIVSRGYGSLVKQFPHEVSLDDSAVLVGDEPLLLAKKTGCPVVIAPKRVKAVQYLLEKHQSQIIISDDGLQHYAMGRAVEIAVIDGVRGFGNGLCLPAGPLRENPSRLKQVDFIVVNGDGLEHINTAYRMDLVPGSLTQLVSGQATPWSALLHPVAAVAGIGHPQRFFATLKSLGVVFKPYPFADHHVFQARDFLGFEKTVVMTEKDAVKCLPFATETMYFLPVDATLSECFWEALWSHKKLNFGDKA